MASVYLSKVDVANDLYRMNLNPDNLLRLNVLFPTRKGQRKLIAIPLVLSTDWSKSPPAFYTGTKTMVDLANATILETNNMLSLLISHRLNSVSEIATATATNFLLRSKKSLNPSSRLGTELAFPLHNLILQVGPKKLQVWQVHNQGVDLVSPPFWPCAGLVLKLQIWQFLKSQFGPSPLQSWMVTIFQQRIRRAQILAKKDSYREHNSEHKRVYFCWMGTTMVKILKRVTKNTVKQ